MFTAQRRPSCLSLLSSVSFALELHPEKTRLIEFGRYAAERQQRGEENQRRSTFLVSRTIAAGRTPKAILLSAAGLAAAYASEAESHQGEAAANYA